MGNWLKDIDPNVRLLFAGTVLFALMLFASDVYFKDDSQLFQVIAGLLSGFGGALLAMIKAKAGITDGQVPQPPAPVPPAPAPVQAPVPPPPPPPPTSAGGHVIA